MATDMDTNSLIDKLSDELEPCKRACPYRNAAIWGVLSLIYIIVAIVYYGPAIDLSQKVKDSDFLFEMMVTLGIFGFGALASSFLSFPDEMQHSWARTVTVTLFIVFMVWILANIIEEGPNLSFFSMGSCYKGIFIEALPFLALVYLTMKGHSTKPYWLMTMNIFAVTALGWIGLRITCAMYDSMLYSFIHYLLPFGILSVALGFFARKIFKW